MILGKIITHCNRLRIAPSEIFRCSLLIGSKFKIFVAVTIMVVPYHPSVCRSPELRYHEI
jgi:hypothetical protein